MADDLQHRSVELLQTLIRNACVNDGSPSSGHEWRNADVLQQVVEGAGLDVERFEPTPGRVSFVSRIEGSDPAAPSLCLMAHTDVVPVNPAGWSRDPFGGELVDGEVWGRGAVDMLNLTASMAVAFRHLADANFRPRGDLIFFAVADEESGSAHGARWMADHAWDAIRADYVLTENGGVHSGPADRRTVSVNVGEKGVAWRRLKIRGVPGHGSMPFRKDNALVTAAAVINRIAEYRPTPRFHELWRERVDTLDVPDEVRAVLLDPQRIDGLLDAMPNVGAASYLHAGCHTTLSCNVIHGPDDMKTNTIPDEIELHVDIRTLPGEGPEEVHAHLAEALGDLIPKVDVQPMMNDAATISRTDTPLWEAIERSVHRQFPEVRLSPGFVVGFTDSRVYREKGSIAYGAGLMSPNMAEGDFSLRFHGNDERVDVESMGLTTRFYVDVARDLLG